MKRRMLGTLILAWVCALQGMAGTISLEFENPDTIWIGSSVGRISLSGSNVVENAFIVSETNFSVTGFTYVDFDLSFDAGLMGVDGIEASDKVITMTANGLGITGGASGGLGKNVPEGYTVSVNYTNAGPSDVLSVTKVKLVVFEGSAVVSDLHGNLLSITSVDANGWADISSLGISITGPQSTNLFSVWNNSSAQYRLDGVELSDEAIGSAPVTNATTALTFAALDTVWNGASAGTVTVTGNHIVEDANIASKTNFVVAGKALVDVTLSLDAGVMNTNDGSELLDATINMNAGGALGVTSAGSGSGGISITNEGYTVSVDFSTAAPTNVFRLNALQFGNMGSAQSVAIVDLTDGQKLTLTGADLSGGWADVSSLGIKLVGAQSMTNLLSFYHDTNTNGYSFRLTGVEFYTAYFEPAAAGYAKFAEDYNLLLGPEGDDDSDGYANLYEYGVGGNPTNPADTGLPILWSAVASGGTNWFNYIHPAITNADSGIAYSLELRNNLVYGGWTNVGYTVYGTNITGGAFNYVTNRISTATEDQQFIRLKIQEVQ